jgi:hypothetical protein
MPKKRRPGKNKHGGKQYARRGRQPRPEDAGRRKQLDPIETVLREASKVIESADRRLAEGWGSAIQTMVRPQGFPPEPVVQPAALLEASSKARGSDGALIARTMALFGPSGLRSEAEQIYESLRDEGLAPAWLDDLGVATPGEVVMLHHPYGDVYSLHLDLIDAAGGAESIAAKIDVNAGGIVTEVVVGASTHRFIQQAAHESHIEVVSIAPAEARALVEEAFDQLDHTLAPPVEEDLPLLRALVEQRFSLLPSGGPGANYQELGEAERRILVRAFITSPHARHLGEDAADIAETICDFANYLDGNPLRWSPTVVAIFLADWVPRKVIADDRWLRAVPDVVRAWVRFAGERRELPDELIDETIGAVDEHVQEFFEQVGDPDAAGPAKRLLSAMVDAGVDPGDQEAVAAFIEDNLAPSIDGEDLDEEGFLKDWEEVDAEAFSVLTGALADYRQQPAPIGLPASARQLRQGLREGSWPYDYLVSLLDLSPADIESMSDSELLLAATSAWVEPDGMGTHGPAIDPEELSLASVLDHATWLSLVVSAVRLGPGADLSPPALQSYLGDIHDEDGAEADHDDIELGQAAPQVNAPLWQAVGVTDEDDRLTELGLWLLPRALARAWGQDFDAD